MERKITVFELQGDYVCETCGRKAVYRICVEEKYREGEITYLTKLCTPCAAEFLKRIVYRQDPIDAITEMRKGELDED